ncbi:MAG: hypothetical protein GC161_11355 [Planctomycetaceae bacterium]|nr:hypothetical protein [Planctomycetaceae bacterium]
MGRRQQRTERFESLARSVGSACRGGPDGSRWIPRHPLAPGAERGPDVELLWAAGGDVYQVVLRRGRKGSPRVLGRRAPSVRRAEVRGLFEVRTGTPFLDVGVVDAALAALLAASIVDRPGRRARLRRKVRRWSLDPFGEVLGP